MLQRTLAATDGLLAVLIVVLSRHSLYLDRADAPAVSRGSLAMLLALEGFALVRFIRLRTLRLEVAGIVPLAAFLGLCVTSLWVNGSTQAGGVEVLRLAAGGVLFLIASCGTGREAPRTAVWWGIVAAAAWSAVELMWRGSLVHVFVRKPQAIMQPNAVGGVLAWSSMLVLARALDLSRSWQKRIGYGVLFALIFAGALQTSSRASWVGGALGCVVIALLNRSGATRSRPLVAAVTVGALIVAATLLMVPTRHESMPLRLEAWKAAFAGMAESPALGLGPCGLQYAYPALTPTSAALPYQSAHSLWLHVGVQFGLLGLATFSWFLFTLVRGLLHARTGEGRVEADRVGALAALSVVMLHGIFHDDAVWHEPTLLMTWALFGLCAAVIGTCGCSRCRTSSPTCSAGTSC